MVFRFNLTFVFALGWAAAACGQITLHQVELSGSIVQVAPQAIAIKAANGQNWTLKLRNGTKIKVTGSAEPEMLTAGTCVRFTARIDKRTSKGQDKIGNITIFTPTPGVAERTLGVERANAHPQGQDDAHAAGPRRGPGMGPPGPVPGAGPDPGPPADPGLPDEATDGGKAPKKRGPAAKGPDKSVPEVADYDVCAQVVSFRGGRLIVSVPNSFFKPKVTVELAADAQIGLDLGDPSVVKPGDKLSAVGFFIKPGFCDVVESVEVALANPLAPPGRSHRPRPAVHAGDTAHQSGSKAKPCASPRRERRPWRPALQLPKRPLARSRRRKPPPSMIWKRIIHLQRPHRGPSPNLCRQSTWRRRPRKSNPSRKSPPKSRRKNPRSRTTRKTFLRSSGHVGLILRRLPNLRSIPHGQAAKSKGRFHRETAVRSSVVLGEPCAGSR